MVTVNAGMLVEGKFIMLASLGTYLGWAVGEGQLAFVAGVVYVRTAGAHFGVREIFRMSGKLSLAAPHL